LLKTIRLFGIVSRAEFILPNLGSLIMGLAWGATPSMSLLSLATLLVLSFAIINLSSAIGAQVNTFSDRELDSKDPRKMQLVEALNSFGTGKLKRIAISEFILTLVLVSVFAFMQHEPILLYLWLIGITIGVAYSSSPARLKAKFWLAPISLVLALGFFPVLFAYYAFTSILNLFFLISLTGLGLTIYGTIIPTETRDYFGDKEMNIETFTVHVGLVKASLTATTLLIIGAILTMTAFLMQFVYTGHWFLSLALIAIPIAVAVVTKQYMKLYSLSKEHAASNGDKSIQDKIVKLSENNPKWIMIITQTYSAISIILLLSKFLL
jgi:4-hydroxybenzoate polyprenyltransferase